MSEPLHKSPPDQIARQITTRFSRTRGGWMLDPLFSASIAVKKSAIKGDWVSLAAASAQALSSANGSFHRLGIENEIQARDKIYLTDTRKNFEETLKRLAQDPKRADLLSKINAKNGSTKARESLEKLLAGETKGVPILEDLAQEEHFQTYPLEVPAHATLMTLIKGMLGLVTAEFNLAHNSLEDTKSEALLFQEIMPVFETLAKELRDQLHQGQQRIYAALLEQGLSQTVMTEARVLARTIETQLPGFAVAQAHARWAMTQHLEQGQGGQAEVCGRTAALAGVLTREAIATFVSCHLLSLTHLSPKCRKAAQSVISGLESKSFSGALPDGKNMALGKLADAKPDQLIETEGLVIGFTIEREEKLVTLVELQDPSSRAKTTAATVFNHLPHLGVTPGAYCRIQGYFKKRSNLNHQKPCLEIDTLSLAKLAKNNWRIAFLRAAETWYSCWPNGMNMQWGLGPQQPSQDENVPSLLGAGELVYSEFIPKEALKNAT